MENFIWALSRSVTGSRNSRYLVPFHCRSRDGIVDASRVSLEYQQLASLLLDLHIVERTVAFILRQPSIAPMFMLFIFKKKSLFKIKVQFVPTNRAEVWAASSFPFL